MPKENKKLLVVQQRLLLRGLIFTLFSFYLSVNSSKNKKRKGRKKGASCSLSSSVVVCECKILILTLVVKCKKLKTFLNQQRNNTTISKIPVLLRKHFNTFHRVCVFSFSQNICHNSQELP